MGADIKNIFQIYNRIKITLYGIKNQKADKFSFTPKEMDYLYPPQPLLCYPSIYPEGNWLN
jgi:hypothetical protein